MDRIPLQGKCASHFPCKGHVPKYPLQGKSPFKGFPLQGNPGLVWFGTTAGPVRSGGQPDRMARRGRTCQDLLLQVQIARKWEMPQRLAEVLDFSDVPLSGGDEAASTWTGGGPLPRPPSSTTDFIYSGEVTQMLMTVQVAEGGGPQSSQQLLLLLCQLLHHHHP